MRACALLLVLVLALCFAVVSAENKLTYLQQLVKDSTGDLGAAENLGIFSGGECRDVVAAWQCPVYNYFPRFGLEFRAYDNETVAFATVQNGPGKLIESAEYLFPFLEAYFRGHNVQNRTINNTVPFLFQVTSAGPAISFYSLIYFFPRGVSPPAPINRIVQIDKLPVLDVAALTFAPTRVAGRNGTIGLADEIIYDTAAGVEIQLFEHRIPFFESLFLFAMYDPPMAAENRRHELWYAIGGRNQIHDGRSIVNINKDNIHTLL